MRIAETQLDLLPVRLRLTAGTVRAARERGARVVIQSREGTPRLTLILIFVRTASSYFTSESGISTKPRNGGCTDRNREHSLLAHYLPPL